MIKKQKTIPPSKVKKILAIRNDKIGDLVLTSNIITMLRKTYPEAKIDMVVSNENKQLVEKNKSLNKLIVLPYCPRTLSDFWKYFLFSRKIKKRKYDLGVAMRGSFFNILFLLFLGKVKYRIGFYTNSLTKLFLNRYHFKDFKGHASYSTVDMINHGLGTNFKRVWPEIVTDKEDEKKLKEFMKKNKMKKWISIVVDASKKSKQWPLKNFDEIIKHLEKKYPKYKILLIAGDKENVEALRKKNPGCIPAVKENLRLVYLLLKNSDLVIAPDGGVFHMAWTAKANLVGLVPPSYTSFEDTRPLTENSEVFFKEISEITTGDIKKAIKKFLGS